MSKSNRVNDKKYEDKNEFERAAERGFAFFELHILHHTVGWSDGKRDKVRHEIANAFIAEASIASSEHMEKNMREYDEKMKASA